MNVEDKLKELIDQLFANVKASYTAIFIDDKETISKTLYPEKKEKLEELIKLIIGRAHEINEFIPEFGEDYVFAEGEDIAIFILFIEKDIAVSSIVEFKPKFALLKLEHILFAQKIKELKPEIEKYLIAGEETVQKMEEIKTPEKEEIHEKESQETEKIPIENLEEKINQLEEKSEITVEDVKDRFAEELEEIQKKEELNEENIEELEKVLSEEKNPEILEEQSPSLEEILEPEAEFTESAEITSIIENPEIIEEQEYYDPEVLEKIEKELTYEIGPVGRFLLKKRIKELGIDPERITRKVLNKLIDKLANDIIDSKRKERFYKKVSSFL